MDIKPIINHMPLGLQKAPVRTLECNDRDRGMVPVQKPTSDAFYNLVVDGDLGKLTPDQRVSYLKNVAESLGLNPMTRPFGLITLDRKVTLYALKEASTQLAKRDCVSVTLGEYVYVKERNMLMVKSQAKTPDGRVTDELAAISIGANVQGDVAANAYMKLATKAKRRAILSHCGLGMLDESEIETIPNARKIEDAEAPKKEEPAKKEEVVDAQVHRGIATVVPAPVELGSEVSDVFSYNDNNDRQWLINTVKEMFPGIMRSDALALCGTFARNETKSSVIEFMKKRQENAGNK